MKIMLDQIRYKSKPYGAEISAINNRLAKSPQDIDLKSLAQEVINGKTFTPAFFRKKDGKIARKKEYWHSQQIVALDFDEGMTLEEAIQEFSNMAAFMYTTFSHTPEKHKFRVVFALDQPTYSMKAIEGLLKRLLHKYPTADKQCSDCSRLFYGGKEIVEINFANRIKVDSLEEWNPEDFDGTKKNRLIYPAKNTKEYKAAEVKKTRSNTARNIHLIKQRRVSELYNKIKPFPKVVHNNFELIDYLKKQDLRLYLGIETNHNFIDIFHNETNPSASIFNSNKNNGHQMYKCHSESKPFAGTIINVTRSLLNCNSTQAIKFLMEVYHIRLVENEIQMELRAEIDFYKEALQSEDLEELYPNFYKLFSRYDYLQDLYVLLDLVKEHLPSGDDPRLLFNHSIETLAKKFNKSTSVTHTRINLFSFFNLVTKLQSHEVPPKLLEMQQKSRKEKGYKYCNSTYELPVRDYDFFNELDALSLVWMEKGCTTNTVNYEGILRNFGVEEADRVFPQDKGKEITPLSDEVAMFITRVTLELIEECGWTTEQNVLDNVTLYFKGQQKFKKKQFKICFGELMEGYELERIRLNKKMKEELSIEGKGFGYIIQKKQYISNCEEAPISIENYEILD